MFPYPRPTSSGSLQCPSSEKLTDDSADSYYSMPYDESTWAQLEEPIPDRNPVEPYHFTPIVSSTAQTQYDDGDRSWMLPEELVGGPDSLKPMQLPLDVSPTLQPVYDSPPNTRSGSKIPINIMASSNCHVDLSKITEHETWNLTGLDNDIKNRKSTYQSPPSPSQHQHINYPSVSPATIPRRSSFDALSDQQGGKSNGRSTPSSSCETQAPPKRRRSYSGVPERESSPKENDPDLKVDAVVKEPLAKSTSKPLVKGSHSLVERRYRENLNTRMTQLDQILTAIHDRSRKAGDLDIGPRHTEMSGKPRKADVLIDAIRYVKQAEVEGATKTKEIDFLRLRIAALEKLVHCSDCALLRQLAGQQIGGDSTKF